MIDALHYIRNGIIVKTERYFECMEFYRSVLNLKFTSEKVEGAFRMSRFDFGSSYLLVETGGRAKIGEKDVDENPCVLRLDVEDINLASEHLKSRSVEADLYDLDWGKLIITHDPDGNRIEILEP